MNKPSLIKNNSYQNVRHPLYKGLLYISLGICIFSLSLIHLFLLISLAYILKIKALKEEEKLKVKFPEYKEYIKEVFGPGIIHQYGKPRIYKGNKIAYDKEERKKLWNYSVDLTGKDYR